MSWGVTKDWVIMSMVNTKRNYEAIRDTTSTISTKTIKLQSQSTVNLVVILHDTITPGYLMIFLPT